MGDIEAHDTVALNLLKEKAKEIENGIRMTEEKIEVMKKEIYEQKKNLKAIKDSIVLIGGTIEEPIVMEMGHSIDLRGFNGK